MVKEEKKIPLLRFSEFEDSWNFVKMADLYPKIRNGFVGVATPYYRDKGIKYLQGKNIKHNQIDAKGLIYIDDEFHYKKKNSIIKVNDILMVQSGHVGECAVVTEEYKNSNCHALLVATPNDKSCSGFYVYYYYSEGGRRKIRKITTGNTIRHILSSDLKLITVPLPSITEQQKIASFLTDVDELITKLTKKKTLLEQYKKGVMQKIFHQELRFKDDGGNEFPNWEEKKLGQIGSIVSGLTYSPNDIHENGILVLRSSNVKKRLISLKDKVFVNIEEGKFNPVKLNDILICVRNGSKRLIGKNAIIKEKHIGLAFGAFMTIYRSAYNEFLFNFFDSQHYKKEVHKNLGATINSINGGDLKKFKVPFPCIKEQTKIANFLSDIDVKIEALNTKIENSKTFKKGLLQQMFV